LKNTHSYPKIEGKYVNLREAEVDDSEFILELRTNPEKARYINKTDSDLNKQIQYMKNYKTLDNEWYFIIEDKEKAPIGTICIYQYPLLRDTWINPENNKCFLGVGRWLMKTGALPMEGSEGDYLAKKFFFETLKQCFHPMYIHEQNTTVFNFQKKWGAKVVGWNEEIKHHLLELRKEDYEKNKQYFERFLYGIIK
jgi:hypothetical protein